MFQALWLFQYEIPWLFTYFQYDQLSQSSIRFLWGCMCGYACMRACLTYLNKSAMVVSKFSKKLITGALRKERKQLLGPKIYSVSIFKKLEGSTTTNLEFFCF